MRLFVGDDWAEDHHDVEVMNEAGKVLAKKRLPVELEELPSNPLDRLSWKPPKVSDVVDRRVVVNPRQARELLTAVTYVGQQRRGHTHEASGSWLSMHAGFSLHYDPARQSRCDGKTVTCPPLVGGV